MSQVLLPVVKCHHGRLFAMQIARLWHPRLMSPVRMYLVAGLELSGGDTGLLPAWRGWLSEVTTGPGEGCACALLHHPLTARGINASKFSWGHQVWAEGRWHARAGAEGKGAFHRLFWRLARSRSALRGKHLSGADSHLHSWRFWAAHGGGRWSSGKDQRVPWEAGPGHAEIYVCEPPGSGGT